MTRGSGSTGYSIVSRPKLSSSDDTLEDVPEAPDWQAANALLKKTLPPNLLKKLNLAFKPNKSISVADAKRIIENHGI